MTRSENARLGPRRVRKPTRSARHRTQAVGKGYRGDGETGSRHAATRYDPRRRTHNRRVDQGRSEEHTSVLQSLMRLTYGVCFLKKKNATVAYLTTRYEQHTSHTQSI